MVSPRRSESQGSGADVRREGPIDHFHGEGEAESTETMKSIRELAAAVLQQTQQNAQILQLTRDHQIQQQQRETTQTDAGHAAFMKEKPPQFKGDFDPEGAEHWIQELEKIFSVMRCREDRKVDYGAFMLTGDAESWWKGKSRLLEEEGRIITWELFRKCFLEKYFPRLTRREKEKEFEQLKQGGMTVGEYARKFENLLKYSEFYQLLPREEWMCQRFQDGLKHEIQRAIAPLHLVKFPELVERCMEVESIDSRRGQVSYGGIGRPGGSQRGGPIRRDNGGRFQQGRGGPYTRPAQQITGPRVGGGERQLTLECYVCGGTHLARDCPRKVERSCYRCGQAGHMARDCFRGQRQGERPIGVGRGAGPVGGRATTASGGQRAPGAGAARPQATGRVFTAWGSEASQSSDLIQGMCLVSDSLLSVLFDSGATHSFISNTCVDHLRLPVSKLPCQLIVSTPTNKPLVTQSVCLKCPITLENRKFLVDLVILPLQDLDIILGMDWLSANHVNLDCSKKTLSFSEPTRLLPTIEGTVE